MHTVELSTRQPRYLTNDHLKNPTAHTVYLGLLLLLLLLLQPLLKVVIYVAHIRMLLFYKKECHGPPVPPRKYGTPSAADQSPLGSVYCTGKPTRSIVKGKWFIF